MNALLRRFSNALQCGTIRTSWITISHFAFQELLGVITTPPITPNKSWRLDKRNSLEKLHRVVLLLLGAIPQLITPKHCQRID